MLIKASCLQFLFPNSLAKLTLWPGQRSVASVWAWRGLLAGYDSSTDNPPGQRQTRLSAEPAPSAIRNLARL